MPQITGHIERITFSNPESGFTVAKMQEEGKQGLTCLVGSMPGIRPGETVRVEGEWKNDPAHGWQFAVSSLRVQAPATVLGIKKYLGSGLVDGIGPVYADRIVAQFGPQTLDIIDEQPNRLLEVEGIGKGRLKKIKACWNEQRCVREVMVFLQGHGVTPAFAQKIYKAYGEESLLRVRDNPYCLARDIFGVGFKTADQIAQQLGIEKEAPRRIEAGIEHVLDELASSGHVCYPLAPFYEEAQGILEAPPELIASQVDLLLEQKRVVVEEGRIWLKALYMTEVGIAQELGRLQKGRCKMRQIDTEKAAEWAQDKLRMRLASEQKRAVEQALSDKVQIITGGPGTGKSTITRAILLITSYLTHRILLAAPTGRAAKRMSEITGRGAKTIHSLLEFDFRKGGFKRGHDNPLSCDLLVVDEASMIDTSLMYSLLKALPDHARVIFVGDIDQLPSVGPGNVLGDLIDSELLPVTRLNHIFRQAAGSKIITNAHRIRKGVFPDFEYDKESDFFFIEEEDPEALQRTLVDLVKRRLPTGYGLNPIEQIQVLAPMRRGIIGTEQLNIALQEALNPTGESLFRFGRQYRVKDKVMQIRNNYDKEVFNGDVGIIDSIDTIEQKLVVMIDSMPIEYEFSDLDELVPAYAVSVHKYQGSECPCIVMPVHTTHFKLLQRNLLYTGVTRGKKLVILLGTKKAVALALQNDEANKRYTGLQDALRRQKGCGQTACPPLTTV